MSTTKKYVKDAIDTIVSVEKTKIELAKETYDGVSAIRRSVLRDINTDGNIAKKEDILGRWYLKAIEVPGIGIRREAKEDYYLELREEQTAVVCVNGIKYETKYKFEDSCILFEHAELAAMKLRLKDSELYLNGYLGANLVFSKE